MGGINSSNPIHFINAYKSIAETNLNSLQSKQSKSKEDDAVIRVLTKEIKNLEHEKTRLQAAKKVDHLFMRAIKYIGELLTAPIRLVVRLFVREKSTEERIQRIADKILNTVTPERIFADLVKQIQSYSGEMIQNNNDVVKLIFGVEEDGKTPSNNLEPKIFGSIVTKHQYWMDQKRLEDVKIGDEIDKQDIYGKDGELDTDRVAARRYEKMKDLIGFKELDVVSSFLSQSMLGDITEQMATKLGIIPPNLDPKFESLRDAGYIDDIMIRPAVFVNTPDKHEMSVTVENDKVYAFRDQRFEIRAMGRGVSSDGVVIGYVDVKREISIPREELRAIYDWMLTRESNTAMKPELMPNLKVTDSFYPFESRFKPEHTKVAPRPNKPHDPDEDYFDWTTDEFWQNR